MTIGAGPGRDPDGGADASGAASTPAWETLSIADLRLVVRLADGATISAVALDAGYSQSAMSRRVARVERAVGRALIRRHGSSIKLTEGGRLVAEYAAHVLAAHRRALDRLAADAGEGTVVELGAFTTANAWLVPTAIASLRDADADAAYSALGFAVTEQTSVRLLASVRSGGLDAAVVSDYPSGTDPAPGVAFHHLLDDPLLVALPAGHRLATRASVGLAELADERWIEASGGRPTVLQRAARDAGFDPVMGHEVREWTAKLGFVAAGLGVSVVPRLLTRHVPVTVALVEIPELGSRRVHLAVTDESPPVVVESLLPALRRLAAGSRP